MKILVTGAGGFIGSHLTDALIRDGHEVRAMVRYSSHGSVGWLKESVEDRAEIFYGDVRDRDSVRRAVDGAEFVFHLAALGGVPYSTDCPQSYIDTNVTGTLNVLSAAKCPVIVTSTSEVYGSAAPGKSQAETDLPRAQSVYAATKTAADQLALVHGAMIVRPFNTYGPRQSPRAVIPRIILQWNRVVLGALDTERDFLYVSDTVAGFLAAMRNFKSQEVVNLGTGLTTPIIEIATMLKAHSVVSDESLTRDNDVTRLCCDWRKAESMLGWEPRVALSDGLRMTKSWYADNAYRFNLGQVQ